MWFASSSEMSVGGDRMISGIVGEADFWFDSAAMLSGNVQAVSDVSDRVSAIEVLGVCEVALDESSLLERES